MPLEPMYWIQDTDVMKWIVKIPVFDETSCWVWKTVAINAVTGEVMGSGRERSCDEAMSDPSHLIPLFAQ